MSKPSQPTKPSGLWVELLKLKTQLNSKSADSALVLDDISVSISGKQNENAQNSKEQTKSIIQSMNQLSLSGGASTATQETKNLNKNIILPQTNSSTDTKKIAKPPERDLKAPPVGVGGKGGTGIETHDYAKQLELVRLEMKKHSNWVPTPNPGPRGRFISFEGIHSSGKMTQMSILSLHLKQFGIKNMVMKIPDSSTASGQQYFQFVDALRSQNKAVETPEEYLKMYELLTQCLIESQKKIVRYLEKGITVLCNKFSWTKMAEGLSNTLSWKTVLQMERAMIIPDLVLYLKLDPRVAYDRELKRPESEKIPNTLHSFISLHKWFDYLYEHSVRSIQSAFTPDKILLRTWPFDLMNDVCLGSISFNPHD